MAGLVGSRVREDYMCRELSMSAMVVWCALGVASGCSGSSNEAVPEADVGDTGPNDDARTQRPPFPNKGPGTRPDTNPPVTPSRPTQKELPSCLDPKLDDNLRRRGEGADMGESCDLTASCRFPLLCLDDVCRAPNEDEAWCDGLDVLCAGADQTCIGGWCLNPGAACGAAVDCPMGYECGEGNCWPVEGECYVDGDCYDDELCDYGVCVNAEGCTIKADLRGDWAVETQLNLGEAVNGLLEKVLRSAQVLRDIIDGYDVELPPELFNDNVLAQLAAQAALMEVAEPLQMFLLEHLEDYQYSAISALASLGDVFGEVTLVQTLNLDASCRQVYRGTLNYDRLEMNFQGQEVSVNPDDLFEEIGEMVPSSFGAVLRCHSLTIDEFHVQYLLGGLARWASDAAVRTASGGRFERVEDALDGLIDCDAFQAFVANHIEYESVSSVAGTACNTLLNLAVTGTGQALDSLEFEAALMRMRGVITVEETRRGVRLRDGRWTGSIVNGEFSGEFDAVQR
jgi:hypothetical protein